MAPSRHYFFGLILRFVAVFSLFIFLSISTYSESEEAEIGPVPAPENGVRNLRMPGFDDTGMMAWELFAKEVDFQNDGVYEAFDLLEGKPSQIIYDAPDEYLQIDYKTGAELQESRQGTDGALVDSPWQLPGEFVVDQSGIIRLAHRYQHCEDWPNPSMLIPAIKEAIWENK